MIPLILIRQLGTAIKHPVPDRVKHPVQTWLSRHL